MLVGTTGICIQASLGSGSFRWGVGMGASVEVGDTEASTASVTESVVGWAGADVASFVATVFTFVGSCPEEQAARRVMINKRKRVFCFIVLSARSLNCLSDFVCQ